MVAIIDYEAGNIRSVCNALGRLGVEYILSDNPEVLLKADKLILPGVGNAAEAMASLRRKGLCELICSFRKPVLGICVGMQIMCRYSEEGDVDCLGIFDASVRLFPKSDIDKVPHMGWNKLENMDGKLFRNIPKAVDVYFVHSYYANTCPDTIATCRHGNLMFSAALKYENFYGTQFHPEKSGSIGEKILSNFVSL